jgi:hypothetical protein
MPLVRTAVACAICAVLACAAGSQAADSDTRPFRIVHRGSLTLPQAVRDRNGNEVLVTGLSGITWLGHDRYAAIMDNSDTLILFSLALARDGTPREATDFEVVTLAERHDYEDVAGCPEPLQQRIAARRMEQGFPDPGRCVLVCEEDTPAIRVASLADGSLLGVIPSPDVFATRRPNRGFESLCIEPDGRHIWTANEEALATDGPAATAAAGTVVRLARITIPLAADADVEASRQLAYEVDPPHHFVPVFPGDPLSGIVAIAGLKSGQLLVLERSGCPGLPPFENRIFLIDARSNLDISDVDRSLATKTNRHVAKTLLWKDQLGCNIEGLCLGPKLFGNEQAMLAVADNNGNGAPNQLVGFILDRTHSGVAAPLVVFGVTIAMLAAAFLLRRFL